MLVEIDYITRFRATYDIPDNIANLEDFKTWFFENYDSSLCSQLGKRNLR